jgi:hypothetical protein
MERFRTLEQPPPDEDSLHELLQRLGEDDGTAWGEFLAAYAPLIYRAISLLESDPDHLSDCFIVCSPKKLQTPAQLSPERCRLHMLTV